MFAFRFIELFDVVEDILSGLFTVLLCAAAIETGASNPNLPSNFVETTYLVSMPMNPKFASNLAFIVVHKHLFLPDAGKLNEMSRK